MPDYVYEDKDGKPSYRVVRYGGKKFRHEHPENGNGWADGRGTDKVLPYRLPEVLDAIDQGEPIWICEGEKDVDTARLQGVTATCNSGGAGKWRDSHSNYLRSAEPVYIVWDNDPEGRSHALAIETSLRSVGVADVRFRRAAFGKDLTDHITAGGTLSSLVRAKPKAQPVQVVEESTENDDVDFLPAAFQYALTKLNRVTPEYGEGKENQYNALCPAHDDVSPSLSIRPGTDVAVMVKCHAGCSMESIARALGMNPAEFTVVPARKLDKQEYLNEQAYMRRVAQKHADQKIMQEQARRLVKFDDEATLVNELAIELKPVKWLIDSWFRANTSVLMNADPKAGKTRLALNLVQSLVEEQPFLGHFQCNWPEGQRAWYGNWDMPEDLFREYLHNYNWVQPDRMIVKHIGAMEFPFWLPNVFDEFVSYAQRMKISLMVVDTLHVASQGYVSDFNDNDEVSQFIHLLRKLCKAAGVENLLMLHHTGHGDKTRGRGASTLAADVDGIWLLQMEDPDVHDSPRFLSARGRMLGQSSLQLGYSMATESYSTSMQTRSVGQDVQEVEAFCERIRIHYRASGEWPSIKSARRLVHKKTTLITRTLKLWEGMGYIRRVTCEGGDRIEVVGKSGPWHVE
jgi:hypothetical protein